MNNPETQILKQIQGIIDAYKGVLPLLVNSLGVVLLREN